MRKQWFFKGAGAILCALTMVGLTVGTAAADDPALAELRARLEALEKQNKELQVKFQKDKPYEPENPGTPPKDSPKSDADTARINNQIDAYMKERDTRTKADDAKKKADDALKASLKEEEGYKIGTDLGLTAKWNYQQGLLFETANKDIRSHVGFFFQGDSNFFTQSPRLKPANQLNDLQDGSFFRRIRPLWDGSAYDTFEWNIILALEQLSNISSINGGINPLPRTTPATVNNTGNGNGLINLDEMWVGLYNLPYIGRVRFGHLKVPQGLEGNQYSSSRAMTFQENASYTDAFYNVFGTGVQILNSAFDDHMTWQGMFYRDDFSRGNTGAQFGDGTYCATGRITGLLIDECEDRHLMHVGLSGTWRKATRADNTGLQSEGGLSGPTQARLRARPELRDAIGGFGDGFSPGDSARLVDTGAINCESTGVLGSEFLYILGPLSFQAEYALCYLNNAVTGVGPAANRTRSFNGGYVAVSYFLTGETRAFNKSQGIFSTFYLDRPFTNFWFNRREDGSLTWGPGAWEVAARFSYLNLNDGPIQGGVMDGTTIGLNWYLSTNMKLQFEYLDNNRYHKASGAGGNAPGVVQGFGTRVQLQF